MGFLTEMVDKVKALQQKSTGNRQFAHPTVTNAGAQPKHSDVNQKYKRRGHMKAGFRR